MSRSVSLFSHRRWIENGRWRTKSGVERRGVRVVVAADWVLQQEFDRCPCTASGMVVVRARRGRDLGCSSGRYKKQASRIGQHSPLISAAGHPGPRPASGYGGGRGRGGGCRQPGLAFPSGSRSFWQESQSLHSHAQVRGLGLAGTGRGRLVVAWLSLASGSAVDGTLRRPTATELREIDGTNRSGRRRAA